jgi:hypothetical protein
MLGSQIARSARCITPIVQAIVLAIAFSVAVQAIAATAPTAPSEDLFQQLSILVQRFTKAQEMFDAASLKELTAENYVEVSPAGEVDPRAKMLESYAPDKKLESPDASVTEVDIRMFGRYRGHRRQDRIRDERSIQQAPESRDARYLRRAKHLKSLETGLRAIHRNPSSNSPS